ncbi:MAG: DUF4919 domain-containing protein [Candidatus Aureabacteria bacterium]|nr:DUF4919 domain-containing protein [Candidatus Auribacterota bacterium]
MKINKIIIIVLSCFIINSFLHADESITSEKYFSLVERIINGERDINFLLMRLSYTKTELYVPYGSRKKERKKVLDAFQKKKYKKVLKLAEKVFKTDFIDMNTHYMCMLAAKRIEDNEKVDFHQFIVTGLLDSITMGSNGETVDTAYKVISTREEDFILTSFGYTTVRREEIRKNDAVIDKVFAEDFTGKKKSMYFNKNIPNEWLNKKYTLDEEVKESQDENKKEKKSQ